MTDTIKEPLHKCIPALGRAVRAVLDEVVDSPCTFALLVFDPRESHFLTDADKQLVLTHLRHAADDLESGAFVVEGEEVH